jgi:ribonuclease III
MSGETALQRTTGDGGDLASLERRIGHRFKSRQLLLDALTHRSYAYENAAPGVVHNERLEFLGDAVLQLLSSDLLYRRSPKASEGDLSNLRTALVRASTLAGFARRLGLGPYLRLGRGEEATGGRDRELLIASAFEAVLGAVYLDGGLRTARAFAEPLLRDEIERVTTSKKIKDDKSLLQELAQAQLGVTPTYAVVSQEGPSHDRTFVVEVHLGDFVAARGEGHSKRQAEQDAAHSALADEGWQTASGSVSR